MLPSAVKPFSISRFKPSSKPRSRRCDECSFKKRSPALVRRITDCRCFRRIEKVGLNCISSHSTGFNDGFISANPKGIGYKTEGNQLLRHKYIKTFNAHQ